MSDALPEPDPVVVDLPEMRAREALTRLRNARAAVEQWTREEKEAKRDLIEMMKLNDREYGDEARINGKKVFTYRETHGGNLDTTKLKENLPDVYGAYYRPSVFRTFRLTP